MAIQQLMLAQAASSSGGDPYWANVKSLLNMGGADGSTTFTDSTGLRSWTANGDAQIDTSLGYNAALFDGTGDYIDTAQDSALTLSGDFTIELIIRISSMTLSGLFANGASAFTGNACALILNHATQANKVGFWAQNAIPSAAIVTSNTLSVDTDYHIEIARSGSAIKLFQNGVAASSASVGNTIALSESGLRVGRYWNGGFNGFVRAFRVTVGVCRHTANFTPPTAPFPTS